MTPSDASKRVTRQEWRALGFFYDLDQESRTWIFIGSKAGLGRFRDLLQSYISDPRNLALSEHEHYGPYGYLEIMTWRNAGVDEHSIHGTISDLRRLSELVGGFLDQTSAGDSFEIAAQYSPGSSYKLHFEVREDGFDPASADPDLREETG